MLQIACSKAAPCSSGRRPLKQSSRRPARPGHAQRAALVERLIVVYGGRGERAGGQCDGAGRLADRDARQLRVGLGRRALGSGCDLVERQRARAECVVECRQAAQRLARARDLCGGAVVAARDLRQPLRAGGAARCLPVPASSASRTISVCRCARRACCSRSAHLAAASLPSPLPLLVDRPFQCGEHTFVSYQPATRKVCRKCADLQGVSGTTVPPDGGRCKHKTGSDPNLCRARGTCMAELAPGSRCLSRCRVWTWSQGIRPPLLDVPRQSARRRGLPP